MIFTPDQLPSQHAKFVAYDATPVLQPTPSGDGEAIEIRSQTLVNYYPEIGITSLQEGGRTGKQENTLGVVFDHAGLGLAEAIVSTFDADDPAAQIIRSAHAEGRPVAVALESKRRKKTKTSKSPIEICTPIHALLGATEPGGKGNSGAAGENTFRSIAMVNGKPTRSCVSDPAEWVKLIHNDRGDLAPTGWKIVKNEEAWEKYQAITPSGQNSSVPAAQSPQNTVSVGAIDPQTLFAMVKEAMRLAFKEASENQTKQESAERGIPTGRPGNGGVEPKPWVARASKNHMNLGSYAVASEGYALRWAFSYLHDNPVDGEIREHAQHLAELVQSITDKVQSQAYDGEIRATRSDGSHKEISLWVRHHIDKDFPYAPSSKDFVEESWCQEVYAAALESVRYCDLSAMTYMEAEYNARRASQQQNPESSQPEQVQNTTTGEANPVLVGFCQALALAWNDSSRLTELGNQAQRNGVIKASVWADPRRGIFSATKTADAQTLFSVSDLLGRQLHLLNQAQVSVPQQQGIPPQGGTSSAPVQGSSPASPAIATAPNHAALGLAKMLSEATTADQVSRVFSEVKTANLLTVEIPTCTGGPFGVIPCPPSIPGHVMRTFNEVFSLIEERQAQSAGSYSEAQSPQSYADRAVKAQSVQEIEVIIAEANAAGVTEGLVTVGGHTGSLGAYLSSAAKRAARNI